MQYIYALATDVFRTKQDIFDSSPGTEYFYVGRTKNPETRKKGHESKAKNGSEYPYHQKIRELGDNWDLVELNKVEDDRISDEEDYYIVKLTAEGHPLLNIKRGNRDAEKCKEYIKRLKGVGVTSSKDYSKIKMENRKQRILLRERKIIDKSLVHIGLDDTEKKRIWKLGDREIIVDRYVSRKDLVEQLISANIKQMDELLASIQQYISGLK